MPSNLDRTDIRRKKAVNRERLEPVNVSRSQRQYAQESRVLPEKPEERSEKQHLARAAIVQETVRKTAPKTEKTDKLKKTSVSAKKTKGFQGLRKNEREPVPVNARHEKNEEQSRPSPFRIRRREQRSGCLAGFMYFMFIVCLSIVIAFFTWMAASDVMALNKKNFEATVLLPASQFKTEEVQTYDEEGNINGTKTITHADIDYVCDTLYKAGLIHYKWLFKFYCGVSNADVKFDPGEYDLKSTYDYRALVQNMREGAGGVSTVTVTIPEGFSIFDIFARFAENKVASYDALIEAAGTAEFKENFLEGTEADGPTRLEGYLYPDTYEFYVGMEPSSAINKLLHNFAVKYDTGMLTQTKNQNTTIKSIITVASIIEKEAVMEDDRAYVASVIYNRLRAGMTLGMDSTILYIHQDHEDEPTAEMLAEDSPYNTHIYAGLPPTPICNPGMPSITAALNPATSDYYYFYADKDTGKLQFFSNYNDFINYANTH